MRSRLLRCFVGIRTALRTAADHEDGMTTAEEVRSRLGKPYSEFEQSRIVTYRVASPDNDDFKLAPWAPYELVFVFDGSQILKRHVLIQLW